MVDAQDVSAALKMISNDYWDAHHEPLLLSNLPPLLDAIVPNYKEHLGSRTLKAFIKEVAGEVEVRLVEHPTHLAKVAVVPASVSFEFPAEARKISKKPAKQPADGDEPVLVLLRALALLPPDELDKVNIPVSTLVKLLK